MNIGTLVLIREQTTRFVIYSAFIQGGHRIGVGRNRLFVLLKSARILWQQTGQERSLDSCGGV